MSKTMLFPVQVVLFRLGREKMIRSIVVATFRDFKGTEGEKSDFQKWKKGLFLHH